MGIVLHLFFMPDLHFTVKGKRKSCIIHIILRILTSSTGVSMVKQRNTCIAPAASDDPRLHTTT